MLASVNHWVQRNLRAPDSDFSPEQLHAEEGRAVGAAVAGGVVAGAVAGGIAGFMMEQHDAVKEVWVTHDILDPSLAGYSHYNYELTHEVPYTICSPSTWTDSDGNTHTDENCTTYYQTVHDGWEHQYNPNINNTKVGTYQTPTLVHSSSLNLLTGSLVGAAAGAGVGLLTGASAALLIGWLKRDKVDPNAPPAAAVAPTTNPVTHDHLAPRGNALQRGWEHVTDWADDRVDDWNSIDPRTQAKIAATAGGTLAGAGIGFFAGQQQVAHQTVITRTYPVPDLANKNLGQIPQTWSEYTWSQSPDSPGDHGWVDVVRPAPQYDANHNVLMKNQTTTVTSHEYGPVMGALAGAGIGAGVGFLGSVAVDILTHFKDPPANPYP